MLTRTTIALRDTRLLGKLRAIAQPRTTIAIGDGKNYFKILLLAFGADGSIYIQFPYFRSQHGIVANLEFGGGTIARRWMLNDVGYLTSHLTKFAHHIDGEAHFSQDGKVKTLVRRQSFRLDGPIGHLFQMTVFGLHGFERWTERDERKKRPCVFWSFGRIPEAVNIVGEWTRAAMLQATVPEPTREVGPPIALHGRDSREETRLVLFAPPRGPAAQTHFLTINSHVTDPPTADTDSTLVFIGGWDPHELGGPEEQPVHTGALMATYPVSDPEQAALRMPTIDLPKSVTSTA